MMNVSWQLFPIHGSHFDQRINGVIMAIAAAFVVCVWASADFNRLVATEQ
jgi:hypothetical protein